MFISVFDIFKIGIGPSSSHTVGPMVAARLFLQSLATQKLNIHRIQVRLYGSLAFTGKGHGTDLAVIRGLAGFTPETADQPLMAAAEQAIYDTNRITRPGFPAFSFNPTLDLTFDYGPPLPGHANGLRFFALGSTGELIYQQTYYSIGGGFVVLDSGQNPLGGNPENRPTPTVPYPFKTADEMLAAGQASHLSIAAMKRINERALMTGEELDTRLDRIWQVMADSIHRGLLAEGNLPGGLQIKRRAKKLHMALSKEMADTSAGHVLLGNEWLAHIAMAVNEENAAGGKIVTAPTNGAAGVIPAVINFYLTFYQRAQAEDIRTFLLVAAAIGGIIKYNSSISGAEVGCQGEIGSAAAMAAAGLCAVLGGTNEQIENSAEIALEHHLGMTCDPINGLVQVPCIERNGFGAVKAVTAAMLALRGDGSHFVSLDKCIRTMYQTGLDMNDKYKETAKGGLAVNLVDC